MLRIVVNAAGEEVSRTVLEPAPAPLIRMAAAPSTAGQEAVPGFSKLPPTHAEQEAQAAKQAAPPSKPAGGGTRDARGHLFSGIRCIRGGSLHAQIINSCPEPGKFEIAGANGYDSTM